MLRAVTIDELVDVQKELERSNKKHGPFPSLHHGESALREEFEELWDEIKKQKWDYNAMYKEATQTAAMALKMMMLIRDIQEQEEEQARR